MLHQLKEAVAVAVGFSTLAVIAAMYLADALETGAIIVK
jgi:hypothetical protein